MRFSLILRPSDWNMAKDLTTILRGIDDSGQASEAILPMVYAELRAIAAIQLRQERAGHTLLTTDLVHEAYLRLFESGQRSWNDKRHFFAAAALAMRRILLDHARRKLAAKRTDPEQGISAPDRLELGREMSPAEVLDLDSALTRLLELDERQCQIVHYRVFAGLTGKETAELMGMSERTVAREWFSAKAWLREQVC